MNSVTDEIKARLNIVELVGSYVQLTKSGSHWKACCPFHQERSPSFMVNEEKNMWHCFGCGKGGDAFAFVMEIEGLEFREALRMLAERAGVELPEYQGNARENKEEKDRIFDLLELATKFYEKQLWDGPGKEKILAYLRGRGLSDESIHTFRLGYAPDGWRHMLEFLTSKGYRAEELEAAGLAIKKTNSQQSTVNGEVSPTTNYQLPTTNHYDRFRDRIMFPILDIFGRVIGYSARVAPGGDESQAKYINTPETAVYHKSRALYGLYLAKQAMKQASGAVIVEGNMDVIAMHQAGIGNTVAVSGTALTEEQLTLMKRYGNDLKLFFDMDGAGQKAARKSAEAALQKEMSVAIVAIPSGKDAADMGKESPEKLREAVAASVPAPRYFLDAVLGQHDRTTPEGKRKIVDEYAAFLAVVKNPIERAHWIKELAREIGTEERIVIGVVNAAFDTKHRNEFSHLPPVKEDPFRNAHTFGKRSELLREELIGLCFAEPAVRTILDESSVDAETKTWIGQHPLSFFIIQAGAGDPLSLIEDKERKQEAARLSFRALETPEVANATPEERSDIMIAMAKRYLEDLTREVTRREKLISLERSIDEARRLGDREAEKSLLAEFVKVSSEK
jgi:DNA primase